MTADESPTALFAAVMLYQDGAVFVDDIEVVNCPEEGRSWPFPFIRSVIRLQSLDTCKGRGRDQVFESFLGLLELGLADTDRKVSSLATRNVITVQNGQLAHDVIQSRPESMDDVANNQCPVGIVGGKFSVSDDHTLPLRLVVENERVRFLFCRTPSLDSSIEISEVFLRTLELMSNSGEACDHVP